MLADEGLKYIVWTVFSVNVIPEITIKESEVIVSDCKIIKSSWLQVCPLYPDVLLLVYKAMGEGGTIVDVTLLASVTSFPELMLRNEHIRLEGEA